MTAEVWQIQGAEAWRRIFHLLDGVPGEFMVGCFNTGAVVVLGMLGVVVGLVGHVGVGAL